MDRTELAWAAGFFDAEGWTAAVKNRRGTRPVAQINQADANSVPEVLTRFRAAVGVGRVRGPKRAEGKVDLYHWVASSRCDVRRTCEALLPWLGEVKRAQFELALGRSSLAEYSPAAEEQRAWAAGLFDGDGSTCLLRHRTHQGYRTCEMSITQTSRAGVPEVLTRFRMIVGRGHLNGPSGGSERWEPIYRWKVHRVADIEAVARSLWPWLGATKRAQALAVITRINAQPLLPRGNPAWGNRKTHCINGHEYAAMRLRPYRARSSAGRQRRPSSHCLACVREYARRNHPERKARRSQ